MLPCSGGPAGGIERCIARRRYWMALGQGQKVACGDKPCMCGCLLHSGSVEFLLHVISKKITYCREECRFSRQPPLCTASAHTFAESGGQRTGLNFLLTLTFARSLSISTWWYNYLRARRGMKSKGPILCSGKSHSFVPAAHEGNADPIMDVHSLCEPPERV